MHLTLSPARTTREAAHARSASEPCHPALARLHATVRALRAWSRSCGGGGGDADSHGSSSSTGHGLALLEAVLAALGDLLATPRAAAALRAAADEDGQVLDRFLVLADAHGTFGSALLAAKQSVSDAQAGARRGDGAVVAASARARRRTEKELRRLAAAMRHASRHADAADTGVVGTVAEAAVAAAEASAVVFSGCAAMSPGVSDMVRTVPSHRWLARLGVASEARKVAPAALRRLEELEGRIAGLECESEKVFRRLLQARVVLLNIHSPL